MVTTVGTIKTARNGELFKLKRDKFKNKKNYNYNYHQRLAIKRYRQHKYQKKIVHAANERKKRKIRSDNKTNPHFFMLLMISVMRVTFFLSHVVFTILRESAAC